MIWGGHNNKLGCKEVYMLPYFTQLLDVYIVQGIVLGTRD